MILNNLVTPENLKDVTFVIPFYPDSNDRMENIKCILSYLCKNFRCRILVVEQNSSPSFDVMYYKNGVNYQLIKAEDAKKDGFIFHRTRIINEGIKRVSTKYFSIYDTDCIFEPQQIVRAVEMLREGMQVVYPYSGDFVDIEMDFIKTGYIRERESLTKESKGGSVFMNTEDYFKAGLENENLYGWAPEDHCRWIRLYTLGYRIARVDGKCWHIMHERGINSSAQNPYHTKNMEEFEKVKAMEREELEEYIKTWSWAKK